jgi:toxin ParE1/3/4
MAHLIAPAAEADLDAVWYYVARESASIEAANRLIDSISSRFLLLAAHPYLGRNREESFGVGTRSFAVGEYVIVYAVNREGVLILRVLHGRRDLEGIFSN